MASDVSIFFNRKFTPNQHQDQTLTYGCAVYFILCLTKYTNHPVHTITKQNSITHSELNENLQHIQ